MARDPLDIRGNAIIGIYPDDFEKGHVPGRHGTRRVLCKKSTLDSLPEDEKEAFIDKLYYKKKREIESERNNTRLKTEEKKRNKKKATIREAATVWFDEVEKIHSKITADDYKKTIKLYIKSNGNHLVREFDREYNIQFLTRLKETQNLRNGGLISANTQHKHLRHLKRFINWCHESEYLDNNKKIIMPKVPEKEMETFTIEEVTRLHDFLKNQAYGPHLPRTEKRHTNIYRAFILARNTLLRTGAIWSLKLDNIDLEHGIIRIRENEELNWKPKKMKWPNKPINETLMKFLEIDLANRAPEERYFLDKGDGQPWRADPQGVTKVMRSCCNTLGLPKSVKPFHWGIRATYITWLLNNGVDPVKVQHLADHSSLNTTMLYFNTRQSNQKAAADMLG